MQEYLNTCTLLRLTRSEQATPVDSIKDVNWSSVSTNRLIGQEIHEEDRRTHLSKRCEYKYEDNSLKTLNNKNENKSINQLLFNNKNRCIPRIKSSKEGLFRLDGFEL